MPQLGNYGSHAAACEVHRQGKSDRTASDDKNLRFNDFSHLILYRPSLNMTRPRSSLRAEGEAIQIEKQGWIASELTLLAMTAHLPLALDTVGRDRSIAMRDHSATLVEDVQFTPRFLPCQ